ncbi:unnamed protein product [Urochloa humidicola]
MATPTSKFLNLPSLILPILLLSHRASGAGGIASDTLNNGGNITDGETLVSAGGSFTLGFFSPAGAPTTSKRYLGIWITESGADPVYWVANRDTPLHTTSGALVVSTGGSLRLLDGSGLTAWSSNTTSGGASPSTVAQLLDSGNLVVREQSSGSILWQSFDHPSNTLLASMKFGKNLKTGAQWSLTSWRTQNDPATGDYRRVMDTTGLPDIVTWQGNVKKYRSGPWNGLWFSGVPDMDSNQKLFDVHMVDNADEVSYALKALPGVPVTSVMLMLDEAGVVQVLMWVSAIRQWQKFPWLPQDGCDDYALCGGFGLCSVDTASTVNCSCVEEFSPVNQSQWIRREFSGGCRRDVQLECGNGTVAADRFVVVKGVKLPDTGHDRDSGA